MLLKPLLSLACVHATFAYPTLFKRQEPTEASWPTQQWTYNGFKNGSVEGWLGVPFAQAPTGERRFKAPVAFDPDAPVTQEIRGARDFGLVCPQASNTFFTAEQSGEDCLNLNLWRPANTSNDAKLPVHVFIPGGGFLADAGRSYDGTTLVERSIETDSPIIVVTLNYRLSTFGFLAHPEFPPEDLNAGLLDQLEALRFLKRNVAAVGGDPNNIVISGQSAGSMSVTMHMLFAPQEDLFQGALATGGTANSHYMPTTDLWTPIFDLLTANLSCPNATFPFQQRLDCLRNAPYDALAAANSGGLSSTGNTGSIYFNPSVHPEGYIRRFPQDAVNDGEVMDIPFISGLMLDEGTTQFGVLDFDNLDFAAEAATFLAVYQVPDIANVTASLLELFPDDPAQGSPFNTGNETFGLNQSYKRVSAFVSDVGFDAGTRDFRVAKSKKSTPTWAFWHLAHLESPTDEATMRMGVFHGLELAYVFPSLYAATNYVPKASYTTAFQDFWIAFTAKRDPTQVSADPLQWPQYKDGELQMVAFNDNGTSIAIDDYRKERLQYISDNVLSQNRTQPAGSA